MEYIRVFQSAQDAEQQLAQITHPTLSAVCGGGFIGLRPGVPAGNSYVTIEFDVPVEPREVNLYWYDSEFDPSENPNNWPFSPNLYYNPFSTMRINGGPEIEAEPSIELEPGHYVVELTMTHPTELRPATFSDCKFIDGTIITIPSSVNKVYTQDFDLGGDLIVKFTSQTLPELVPFTVEEEGETYNYTIFVRRLGNLLIQLSSSAYNSYSTAEYWEDLEDSKHISIAPIHSIDDYDLTIPFWCENIGEEDMNVYIGVDGWTEIHDTIPIEYSYNGSNWSTLGTLSPVNTELYSPTITPGQKLYLRANTPTWGNPTTAEYAYINMVAHEQLQDFKVGGNIMSLIYGSNFTGHETSFPSGSTHNFEYLFGTIGNCDVDVSELLLPATVLTNGCYRGLWNRRTLWRGSEIELYCSLPLFAKATVLAENCYDLNIDNVNYNINTTEFNRQYINNPLYDQSIHGVLVYTPVN